MCVCGNPYWPSTNLVTFSSNLNNFKKNSKSKQKIQTKFKTIQKNLKIQKIYETAQTK